MLICHQPRNCNRYSMKPKHSVSANTKSDRWQTSLKTLGAHLTRFSWLLWFNGLTVLLLGSLSVYAKATYKGWGIQLLFTDPFYHPYSGVLTGVSEILWCLPAIVCAFSLGLINRGQSRRHTKRFLLASALLLSVLSIDDRFRLTLILVIYFGVPKLAMLSIYGIAAVLYAKAFWGRLRTTPYALLIVAAVLFAVSSLVDLLHLPGQGTPAMLEDGTKLLGNLNLALYFWYVCQQEVRRSLQPAVTSECELGDRKAL